MTSVPRKWFLVGLKGCPFTKKAENYFINHKLQFRKIIVANAKHANKLRQTEDLLCPDDFKTFPRIWSPMKEFLGGNKELKEMILPGRVGFNLVSATQAERAYINEILLNFSKVYFPDYTMVADSQHPDVELSLLEPEALVRTLVDKHKISSKEAEEFASMSVTLMTRSLPRHIYLNKANFYLESPKVKHFCGNSLGYHLYVVLHEFHHALGFVHHYNSSYKHRKGTECRVLTQQTCQKLTRGTKLMRLDRLLPFFSRPDHVENRLKSLRQNLKNKTNQTMSTRLSSGSEKDTVLMTDLHNNYSQWFEGGSDTSVPTIFQEQDLDIKKKPTKKKNKTKIKALHKASSAMSGGATSVTSYDGSTSTKSSSSSASSSCETSSDVSSVVDDLLEDRFDASMTNLTAGESNIYDQSEINGRQSPSEFLGKQAMSTLERLKKTHQLDL